MLSGSPPHLLDGGTCEVTDWVSHFNTGDDDDDGDEGLDLHLLQDHLGAG